MKNAIAILLFAVLLHGVWIKTAAAQPVDRSKKPQAGAPPKAAFPDYTEATLSNGLKVFIVESERQPTVTFRLVIKSGSVFDGAKSGLASFVAEMLTKGTATRTADAFAQEADFIGASVDAGASDDALFVTASGLTKYTAKVLSLFTDAVFNPTFPDAELEKERKKTLSGLQAEKAQPASLAAKLQAKLLFGEHPYGASETEESVKSVTAGDLRAFHKVHFSASNATLAVVGDVKAKELLPQLEAAFGKWAAGAVPQQALAAFPAIQGLTIHLVDRPGSVQSNILVAQRSAARNNPDAPELGVVVATLGGGFSGRLFQNLREKHAWTYGAGIEASPQKLSGTLAAASEVRNAVTDSAIVEILSEMKRIKTELIGEEELTLQREYVAGNYLLSLESASRTASRVQDIDLFGLAKDYYKTYASRVAATTPAKAQTLAKQYLDTDNLVVVVVGEAKEVKAKLEKLARVTVYDTDLKPLSALGAADITADALLAKHIQALGGEAALKKIKSRVAEGTVKIEAGAQAFNGSYTRIEKAPNKTYTKIQTPVMTQEDFTDGKKSVTASGSQTVEKDGEELIGALEEAQFNSMLRFKELGNKMEVKGKRTESIGGESREVYIAEITRPSGKSVTMWFDAKTFLLMQRKQMQPTPGGLMEVIATLSDYRAVDGVMLPHKLSQAIGALKVEILTNTYKHNTKLSDATFIKK